MGTGPALGMFFFSFVLLLFSVFYTGSRHGLTGVEGYAYYPGMKQHLRLRQVFVALLVPLVIGCAPPSAGQVRRPAGEAESAQNPKDGRNLSERAVHHYLKATMLEQQGRLEPAITELRLALAYDNQSPLLHTRLGNWLAQLNLWKPAAQEAEAALALEPHYPEALELLGQARLQDGKLDEAAEIFRRIIASDRKRVSAYGLLSEVMRRKGDKKAAVAVLAELTEANPESAEGFRRIAELSFEQGDEARAEAAMRRVVELEPFDVDTIRTLASLLEQQGRYPEAIKIFTEALEYNPDAPVFQAYMARLYLKMGDVPAANAYFDMLRATDPANARYIARAYAELNMHEEAIAELTAVLSANPELDNERLLLAYLLEEKRKYESAIRELDQIPADSKFYVDALINRGFTLTRLKRFDEAVQAFQKVLSLPLEPEQTARACRYLAEAYGRKGDFAAGLKLLDDAIRRNPELLELVEAKANLLFDAGRGKEGVGLLKKVIEAKPRQLELWYALGSLYERLGQIPESLQAMREVLKLDPHNASALNFIGYTMADRGEDLAEAERMIRRALLLNPGNGAITDSLGWVLYQKGDYAQALEYLIRADRISPGEPVIIMHVGDALRKLGRRAEAIREYRRALTFDPEPRDRESIETRLRELGEKP